LTARKAHNLFVWGARVLGACLLGGGGHSDQVPEGMLMVLGDNRNHSLGIYVWGFLPKENVIGRALFN